MLDRGARPVVLLIDEDELLLSVLTLGLTRRGFSVIAHQDGPLAREHAAQSHWDVAVLDAESAAKDHWGLVDALRAIARRPVVLVSTSITKDDARAVAPDAFIWKPFRISDLVSVIEGCLDDPSDVRWHSQPRCMSRRGSPPEA